MGARTRQTRSTARFRAILATVGLSLAAVATGCAPESDAPDSETPALPAPPPGEIAPQLAATRFDGTPIGLPDLAGKYVLLDFWATWCAPCVVEIPELNALWNERRSEHFDVLALSIDADPPERIEAWTREKGVLYPVAMLPVEASQAWGALQFPYHLLLGPDGRIVERLEPGFHDREELRALLDRHGVR